MSILFLARKLVSDYGLIEQVRENQNRNQFSYRFYSPKPDFNSSSINSLYGSPGSGVISQKSTLLYWYRDGKNSYIIESTNGLTKDELDTLHPLLMDDQHSLTEIIEASDNHNLSFKNDTNP